MADIPVSATSAEEPMVDDITNGASIVPPNETTTDPTSAPQSLSADERQTENSQTMLSHPIQAEAPIVQQQISADEIALYDRQIRLWGVKAQEKLRSARILLVGIKAIGDEVAKNLVLAGIGHLTVIDHEPVTEDDLASQFLVSDEHIGQNRAQAASIALQTLNPRVNLEIDATDIRFVGPEYFSAFDVTIVCSSNLDILNNINAACRIFNRKFYAADTHGMYGYIFADLISHDFVIERSKSNVPTASNTAETLTRSIISSTTKRDPGTRAIELVTKREIYSPMLLANTSPLPPDVIHNRRKRLQVPPLVTCLRALFDYLRLSSGVLPSPTSRPDLELFTKLAREKHLELQLPDETLTAAFLRSFLQNLGSELSPVAAFLGGALAQDVINVLGQREQPLQNCLLFDGEECRAPVLSMHPIFDPMPTETGIVSNGTGGSSTAVNGTNGIVADQEAMVIE